MKHILENIKGLENQAELLVKKLNRLRQALALETDPSSQIKYEHDIIGNEALLTQINQKLAAMYDMRTPEGQTLLSQKIEQLNVEEMMGEIYLVNVDREEMKDRFWEEFDERENLPFQFYFVSACPSQMPPSFAERMIYELIIEELDEDLNAIYCERKEKENRIKIYDLPIGRKLEYCQKAFKKHFSQRFNFLDTSSFDSFIKTGIPRLEYKYVSLVFEIHERKWKNHFQNYFQWLIDSFCNTNADVPKFLFFFVFYIENLHKEERLRVEQTKIIKTLTELAKKNEKATLLTPLTPVSIQDLKAWLIEIGERNDTKIADVLDVLVKGLRPEKQKHFKQYQQLDMSDIEILQKIVYTIHRR